MGPAAAPARRLADELAWRPEWPAVVVAGAAWLALIVPALAAAAGSEGMAGAGGHALHHHSGSTGSGGATLPTLGHWSLMTVAMMTPVALPAVRYVGFNSLRTRRLRAMTLYLASYLGVWVAFGAALLVGAGWATTGGVSPAAGAVALLAFAAGWQLTRWKRRAVIACSRPVPLPPLGWRADRGCVRFGGQQAWRCLASCGPLMATTVAVGHANLLVMAGLTVLITAEKRSFQTRFIRPVAAGLGAATVAAAVFAWT